ncbi:DUF1499 domain-containing protein [Pacificibacter marinus]|uniref:DUF1499 domain-containing protein n=1 Tax=Pacificibacter marinus TaxID=658057 RepID=A0A1Y5RU27_9RHOB|nr:DUF1499 domain-containing protein [Pacificibacter marinus]SEL31912.1 Protein of unknown function [Pacificibacter marinus]SLN22684.1 hypothetical protein PAM7971_00701 [Pacificibacter marinus]
MFLFGCLVLGLLIAAQVYVRLSPMRSETWHVDPFEVQPPAQGGALDRFTAPLQAQVALDAFASVAQSTPRTTLLAGSLQEGRLSYVTRSLLWGFPDVTTIGVRETPDGADVAVFARLRFGKSDMGVNAKRIAAWRAAAGL